MKQKFSILSAGVAGLLFMASTPATADDFAWQKWTTVQGCVAMVFTVSNEGHRTDTLTAFNWDGECTPGQMITGTGTLEEHSFEFRRVYTATGRMVNGFWEGAVKLYNYDTSDDDDTWNPKLPTDDVLSESYIRGCAVDDTLCKEYRDPIVRLKSDRPLFKVAGGQATEKRY